MKYGFNLMFCFIWMDFFKTVSTFCAKLGNLVKLLHVYCVPDTAVVSVMSSQPFARKPISAFSKISRYLFKLIICCFSNRFCFLVSVRIQSYIIFSVNRTSGTWIISNVDYIFLACGTLSPVLMLYLFLRFSLLY